MKKFFLSVLIFFGLVIALILLTVGYFVLRYKGWEKEFEQSIEEEYVITKESIKEVDFGDRVSEFALSVEDTQFLELNVKEMGSILFSVLDSYIGDDVVLENMYIDPSDSLWIVYSKIKYQDISLWISIDINKDEIQSAQVYVTDILIGPFSVGSYFPNWVDMINRGISESVVSLNENGLVGRYIENIEVQEDSVVLKGSRY